MSNTRKVIRSRIKLWEFIYFSFYLYVGVILTHIIIKIVFSNNELSIKIGFIILFAIILFNIIIAINEFKYIIINTKVNRIRVFSLRYIWGKKYDLRSFRGIIIRKENRGYEDYKVSYLVDNFIHIRIKIKGNVYNDFDEIIKYINLPEIKFSGLSIAKYLQLIFTGCTKIGDDMNNKKNVILSCISPWGLIWYSFFIFFGIISIYALKNIIQNLNEMSTKSGSIILVIIILFIVFIAIIVRELKFIIINPHINQIRVFSLFIWGKRYDINGYKGIIIMREYIRYAGNYKVVYFVDDSMHTKFKIKGIYCSNFHELIKAIKLPKIGCPKLSIAKRLRLMFTGRIKIEGVVKRKKIKKVKE